MSFPEQTRGSVFAIYVHKEFDLNRLFHVQKKDSKVAHENCNCVCSFCAGGNCKQVFESDMDLSRQVCLLFPFHFNMVQLFAGTLFS